MGHRTAGRIWWWRLYTGGRRGGFAAVTEVLRKRDRSVTRMSPVRYVAPLEFQSQQPERPGAGTRRERAWGGWFGLWRRRRRWWSSRRGRRTLRRWTGPGASTGSPAVPGTTRSRASAATTPG